MSASLIATLGVLLSAGPDSLGGATPSTPELAAIRSSQEALRSQLEAQDQKIKILERLRENDQDEAAAAAKAAVKLQANASGLWIRSADSAYSIRFRGLVRNGANWDLNDENKKTLDQFQNTTVRFGFDGFVGKAIEYKISSDWSKGSVALQDAYFDLKLPAGLRLRTGKFQVPLGLERFVSPSDLLFHDRAFPSQIAPNRDVGAQVSGAFGSDRVQYAVGVFNGGADGSNINGDANDDKDLYVRLWLQPLKGVSEAFANLGVGFGANAGYHSAGVPTGFRTTAGNTFFSWKGADTLDGSGYRLAPQARWSHGPFLAYGEWIRSVQQTRRGATVVATDSVGTSAANRGVVHRYNRTTPGVDRRELSVSAWQGAFSWVLTGENASDKGVAPRHPFNPSKGEWGALEVSARISGIAIDDKAFERSDFADTTTAARSALSYGAALNWHLIRGTRLQAGFERTRFEDGAVVDAKAKPPVLRDRKSENQLFVSASTSF